MKNCFIMAPNSDKSILESKLLGVFKNKKETDAFYSKLRGKDFKSIFGDWEQRYKDISNPNVVMTGPTYTNGEPMLFQVKGANQYYISHPNGTRMYLNQKGLRGGFSPSEIKEISRYFLFKYVQFGGAESFENIDSKDSQSKMMTIIDRGINDLKEQQSRLTKERDIRVFGNRVKKVEKYKEEFRTELTYELNSLGQTFRETIYDSDGNLSNEVPEDSRVGGVSKKETITVNPKDTATINTKIMLSQLRSKRINKVTGKKEFVRSPYLGTPMFEDFDVVWKALTPLLADKPTTIAGGELDSSYSKMKTVINEITDIYPWADDLNAKLDHMYNSNSNKKYKAFEFVQAFNKTKKDIYVTEVDKKDNTYNFYNATATASRESFVLDSWGTSFAKNFLSNNNVTKLSDSKIDEVREIRAKINTVYSNFNKLKEKALKDKESRKQSENKAIAYGAKNLFKNLSSLGFKNLELGDVNRLIYLGGGVEKKLDTVDKLFVSVDYMLKDDILGESRSEKVEFVDADGNASNPFKGQANVKMLAQAVAMRELDVSEQNVVGPNGKSMHAYSNNTYLSNKIAEFKEDDSMLQSLLGQTVNKSSRWMHYLLANHITNNEAERKKLSKKRLSKFKTVMSTSFTSKNKNDAVDNTQISLDDQINDNMSKSLRGSFVDGGSIFPTIIAGDKSRRMEFAGLEYINSRIFKKKEGGIEIPPRTVGIFLKYFLSEYERMVEVANELDKLPKEKLVQHYHLGAVNGLKSQIFPELSHENLKGELRTILYTKDGRPRDYKSIKVLPERKQKLIQKHIKESLEKRFADTKVEIDHILANTLVESKLMNHYRNNGDRTALVGDYMVNGMVATIEYTKMFSGDPAYYKNQADFIKRMPGTYTDGLSLILDGKNDQFFKAAIIKKVEVPSAYYDLIRDSLAEDDKDIADDYSGVNTTDAQAWITPRRWRFLKRKLGQWGDKHDIVFKKLYTGEKLEQDELKLAAQPLKGVYFDIIDGVPTYLKYSQAVLIPSMIKGGPMERLLNKMQGGASVDQAGNVVFDKRFSEEVHEVITEDGIKVGAKQPSQIHIDNTLKLKEDFELNSHVMFNKGWKLQQDLPVKNMGQNDLGSQVQKNVLDALVINDNDTYKISGFKEGQKGEDVLSMVNKAASKLVKLGIEKVSKELDIVDGVIQNKDKLYEVLIQEFRNRGSNENVVAALEKRTKFDAIPQIRGKIDSILMSVFNRNTVKLATEGGSFIQVSPFGLQQTVEGNVEYEKDRLKKERDLKIDEATSNQERVSIRNDYALKILNVSSKSNVSGIRVIVGENIYDKKGLKPPRKGPDGNTLPGQVMIPHTLALKLLEEAGEDMSRMTDGKFKRFFSDPKTRELVGYRIPNQGMSSNDVLEIVGILPETMGDSIIGYDGIPAKTGSDFDIDKMFIMAPNMIFNKDLRRFEVISEDNKEKYEGKDVERLVAQNELLTLYKDILKSNHTYANMMTSVDSAFLKTDIEDLHIKPPAKDLDLFSPVTQLRIKKDYMDGTRGVGLAANQLIDSVANQPLQIRITEDIGYGTTNPFRKQKGEPAIGYVEMDKDKPNQKRIVHVLSAFLNAYVDIAKDNYITRGNHNDITAGVAFLMIRGGYDIKRLNRFIGQPILKEYVSLIRRRNSITGQMLTLKNGKELATPLDVLKEKYGLLESKMSASNLRTLSDKQLEDNILNGGQDERVNKVALMAFADLEDKAKKWTEGVLAAKVEKGSGGSPTELHVKRNKLQKVLEDGFVLNYYTKFYNSDRKEDTAAGAMRESAFDFVNEVLERSEIQLSATKEAKETIDAMSSRLKKDYRAINLDFAKAVDKGMYAYLMSGTDLMKNNRDMFGELFVSLPERIIEMKESGSKNFLIKELNVDHRGGYSFLGISPNNKPVLYQNNIYRAWLNLYEREETRDIAVDLVKYSYSQSGFGANLSQFFTHIPHEILRDEGVNDDINSFFEKVKALPFDQHFAEQFARHEAENTKVVSRLGDADIESTTKREVEENFDPFANPYSNTEDTPGEITTTKDFAKKHMYKVMDVFQSNYPNFVSKRVGKKVELYEIDHVVYNHGPRFRDEHGVPVYKLTYKLGFKSGKNRIFEYNYNQKVEESVVGWNRELFQHEAISQADAFDIDDALANDFGSQDIDSRNLSLDNVSNIIPMDKFVEQEAEGYMEAQEIEECKKGKK